MHSTVVNHSYAVASKFLEERGKSLTASEGLSLIIVTRIQEVVSDNRDKNSRGGP